MRVAEAERTHACAARRSAQRTPHDGGDEAHTCVCPSAGARSALRTWWRRPSGHVSVPPAGARSAHRTW